MIELLVHVSASFRDFCTPCCSVFFCPPECASGPGDLLLHPGAVSLCASAAGDAVQHIGPERGRREERAKERERSQEGRRGEDEGREGVG